MRDYAELVELIRSFACNQYPQCEDCEMVMNGHECRSAIERQADDAIEELLAENKAIKQSNKDAAMRNKLLCDEISRMKEKVPHWISVEERLPELGQGVLVYDDCEYMSVADYTHDKHFPTVYEFHVNGEYEPGVTHWMPLPEAPKEETE